MSSEGQNDLRETGPEKQHPKKKHAVSVSPWMKKNVLPLRTGFESDFKALAEDEEKIEKLHDEIEKYVTEWRVAAEKLPATSRRSRDNPISEAWIAAARKEFEPVDNSWVLLCHILKVLVRLLRYFDEGDTLKTTRAVLKERGFFHEEAVLESKGYKLYISLRSWLYRRSEAGKRKAREYEKRPEVKKLRKKPREYETERKKAWRAKKKAKESLGPGLMVEEWEPPPKT